MRRLSRRSIERPSSKFTDIKVRNVNRKLNKPNYELNNAALANMINVPHSSRGRFNKASSSVDQFSNSLKRQIKKFHRTWDPHHSGTQDSKSFRRQVQNDDEVEIEPEADGPISPHIRVTEFQRSNDDSIGHYTINNIRSSAIHELP